MSTPLTPEGLAERFGVPVSTVLEWNRNYKWPHIRIGNRIRWTEDQYDEIVRRQTVTPKAKTGLPGQTPRSTARSA